MVTAMDFIKPILDMFCKLLLFLVALAVYLYGLFIMLSSFLPLVLCVMSVRQVLVRCFISLLASYPRVNAVYFCHQTFNAHAFSMQRCIGCQGDADLGTNLQSVLWFLNHKHGMLGMELSNSVLQTSSLFSLPDAA